MMKPYALYFVVTVCLLFVQTSSLLPFGDRGIRPDLIIFIVLHAAISIPAIPCACMVFAVAFFLESLSGAPTGFFIATYLLVFAAIKLMCRIFNFNTPIELLGLLLASLAVKYPLVCFFMRAVYEYRFEYMVQTVLSETFFTLILFPVVFPLIHKSITWAGDTNRATAGRQHHGA